MDTNALNGRDQMGGQQSPGPTASGAVGGSAAPPAAGGSAYLETHPNPVTRQTIATRTIACQSRCNSRFCPTCCTKLGRTLKKRLVPVLATFRRVMMLTFTVDPQHFPDGPKAAFAWVKKNRCLSVTMQALRRADVLASDRWFCVIEWQGNGWPHWHVLVDADFIPFETVKAAWNVNLVKLGKAAAATRVGFGSVRFTVSRFAGGAAHAAGYACAYLTKPPQHGYPQWVLDSLTREVHRYSTSRGFWGQSEANLDEDDLPDLDDLRDEPDDDSPADDDDESEPSRRRTIAALLATCKTMTEVMYEFEDIDPASGEIVLTWKHRARIDLPLSAVLERAGCGVLNEEGTKAVMPDDGAWLASLAASKAYTVVDQGGPPNAERP